MSRSLIIVVNIAFLLKELYFVLVKSGRLVSIGVRYASLVRVTSHPRNLPQGEVTH